MYMHSLTPCDFLLSVLKDKWDMQAWISHGFFYMRNPNFQEQNKRYILGNIEIKLSWMWKELRDGRRGKWEGKEFTCVMFMYQFHSRNTNIMYWKHVLIIKNTGCTIKYVLWEEGIGFNRVSSTFPGWYAWV